MESQMVAKENSVEASNSRSTSIDRSRRWRTYASGGGTVVGVAVAAAFTSYTAEKQVGIAAWVAVAVVGASTMISTAKNSK